MQCAFWAVVSKHSSIQWHGKGLGLCETRCYGNVPLPGQVIFFQTHSVTKDKGSQRYRPLSCDCLHQATRQLVESVTRQLLEGTQGVQVLYGTTATGLVVQQEEGQREQRHPTAEGGGHSHKRVTGECEGVDRGCGVL